MVMGGAEMEIFNKELDNLTVMGSSGSILNKRCKTLQAENLI